MTHPLPPAQSSIQPTNPYLHERIRQARLAFNVSASFATLSAATTLAGVVLLLSGNLSQGSYATLGGLTSTAVGHRCMQLSREANDRLDRINYNFAQPALPEGENEALEK